MFESPLGLDAVPIFDVLGLKARDFQKMLGFVDDRRGAFGVVIKNLHQIHWDGPTNRLHIEKSTYHLRLLLKHQPNQTRGTHTIS